MKFDIQSEDYLIDKYTKIDNVNSYNTSLLYGEVDYNDICNIIKFMLKKMDCDYNLNFLDIGSGCGKLVIYLNENTDLYCTGIEIIKHRYLRSLELLQNNYNIDFINDNFTNIYLGNFDIIYCCNVVFSEEDNNMLYSKLNNEFKGYVLLFTYNNKINHHLVTQYNVNTSWQKNVLIYLFYF